jgi:hypothetical protein
MINFPSAQELEELVNFRESNCVTIYAPYIEANTTANPNRIQLKNLLKEAEAALTEAGLSKADIASTLQPGWDLQQDSEFWPIHREGMVLFMHSKLFHYYHVSDASLEKQLTVQAGFHLQPLLDIMQHNQPYYVLALGHKNVRLYEGDHYQLKPVQLKNFPSDLLSTLNIDEFPNSRETHSIAPASSGKGSEGFHQQYNVAETDKQMLLEYFRRIDRYLHAFLNQHGRPLIIAGVNSLLPIYRKVNTYPGLLKDGITGNQEYTDTYSLKQKAWNVVSGSMS